MEECRLFIGNLPSNTTEEELKSEFGYYGAVKSVELKKKNDENVYGFVNVELEEKMLTKCIREFSQQKFKGNYLSVSKAKESFLDRLQKEREQKNVVGSKLLEMSMKSNAEIDKDTTVRVQLPTIQKEVESSEESSSEEEEPVVVQKPKVPAKTTPVYSYSERSVAEDEPEKLDQATLDDMKRLQSLQKLKDLHKEQKNAIRNALMSIDSTAPRANKIVFERIEPEEDKLQSSTAQKRKSTLFDGEDDDDEEEIAADSFKLKKQFEGKRGERLLELQTKFQGDKRFKIDEKFAEDADEYIDSRKTYTREELKERKRLRKEMINWDQDDLKEERDNQLNILESITGQSTGFNQKPVQKGMLRFDPSKKSHDKYLDVVRGDEQIDDDEMGEDKLQKENVEVGEERFFKVADNLTDVFKASGSESQPFSIFGMLGINHDESNDNEQDDEESAVNVKEQKLPSKLKAFQMSQVQFKYDSSDTDEEAEKKKAAERKKKIPEKKSKSGKYSKSGVFRHNFFFSESDERLKEAYAFIKKSEFIAPEILAAKRSHLKKIVKSKVRKAKVDKAKLESKKRKKTK